MPSHMPYDQQRYKLIREQQKRMEEDVGGRDSLPAAKLLIQGQVQRAPIYRFNSEQLWFNKANGRLRSEILAAEAHLGRELDVSESQDQVVIKDLLLGIRPDENEKIKEDLRKSGQMQPGIITCDGIVINGNRRKALLEELYDEAREEKFRYLEVHVLPSNITKAEVWLIEAGIQMSAPQQLDYSPINNLLKLKEGATSGISVAEMASRIYGMSAERLQEDLDRLTLIDEYLVDYLGKSGRYYLLKDRNEHFIDLQNILTWLKRPRGNVAKDWDPDDSDIAELKVVAFHLIHGRFPHLRIRDLRDIFCIQSSWREMRRALHLPAEVLADVERDPMLEGDAGDAGDYEDDVGLADDQATEEQASTAVEGLDRREEVIWRQQNLAALKQDFENAKEQREIHEYGVKPLILAKRAYRNLEGIRIDSVGFDEPELDDRLRDVIHRANELRSHHQRKRKKTRAKAKRRPKGQATQKVKRRGKRAPNS